MILWRRFRGWWWRLWHHPLEDYRRLRTNLPTAPKPPPYSRRSGIPPCGSDSCRRKPLRGRVHCPTHAAAHARRLQARRRRKARRAHLQRIRRR